MDAGGRVRPPTVMAAIDRSSAARSVRPHSARSRLTGRLAARSGALLLFAGCARVVVDAPAAGGEQGAGAPAGATTSSTKSTGSSGGTAAPVLGPTDVCEIEPFGEVCGACVGEAMAGPCSGLAGPCDENGSCDDYFDQLSQCWGDSTCCAAAASASPDVAALFAAMVTCAYCRACSEECAGAFPACDAL